jgi:hypothetical protein
MSHFVVLVFGEPETVESQLEPYDENIEMDPYWEDECTDMTAHWLWPTLSEEAVTPITTMEEYAKAVMDRYAEDNDKYRVREGVFQRQTTYNPESKWDWWVEGGRWGKMLQRKDGQMVDSGRVSDIDWEGMREAARKKAEDDFDLMWNIIGKRTPLVSWKSFLDKYPDDIPKAREEYNGQETLQVLRSSNIGTWGCPVETYHLDAPKPRTAYIEACVNSIPFAYAMVKDGEWITKGRMGWWGMSDDDMTDAEWKKIVRKAIDDSPDDYITVVDAHI